MPRPNAGPRLTRKGDRPEWYIVHTVAGRTRRYSTGTTDRAAAESQLTGYILENGTANGPDPLLSEVLGDYLREHASGVVAPHVLKERAAILGRHIGRRVVSELGSQLGRDYVAARTAEGVGPATIGDEMACLNAALKHAAREGRIAPVLPLKLPPRPPPRDRWLTPKEADKLLSAAKLPHMRLYIVLALATGLRPGAILDLTWDRVDLGRLRLDPNPPGRVETRKRRPPMPLPAEIVPALKEARETRKTEWVIEFRGARVKSIKRGMARLAQRVGLKGVSAYTLRHTAATWMAQDDIPLWRIAGMMGHKTTRTTERVYAKHSPSHLRDASDALGKRLWTVMGQKRSAGGGILRKKQGTVGKARSKKTAGNSQK
jgi:integrase